VISFRSAHDGVEPIAACLIPNPQNRGVTKSRTFLAVPAIAADLFYNMR
jgi:hypothetical protein